MKNNYSPRYFIPVQYIIELGMIKKMNKCAKCGNSMDVPNHNIQLCTKCRRTELNMYAKQQGSQKSKTTQIAQEESK